MAKVLIAGESWMTTSTHVKGVDEFSVHSYVEGVGPLKNALEASGHEVIHMPAHKVPMDFPGNRAALNEYDVVVLSDIGANSIQLAPGVFERFIPGEDRLQALADWTRGGGALVMIGGYLSFSGIQARAAFRNTAVADVLPVEILPEDDRWELPAGMSGVVHIPGHQVLGSAGEEWPLLLGYNRTVLKEGSELVASINGDPLIALSEQGDGRSAVFTSDCSPHWAPTAFCEDWTGYREIFDGIIRWVSKMA
ncbi:glutamine amidotransferase [Arthrobacter sp. H14-L1]|uniref:glutamine amidotransferase n=1 Tax=Arthrobacter sp. H14-L1 TaxID=2996697 RepID=UPI00226E0432|nr:glutamine amidotransferase [Arthrobacter sp. H14-L1]MCY0906563.1 glutamine amidotransferase [Arthrobacter sp. H14-L1]